MPTFLDIILYEGNILKNENIKNNKFEKENKFEENKKYILESFVNYPRLELIKKYKIQTQQILMNNNYRTTFIKLLIIPITFELIYNFFKK
jgi:hypothetical protein